MNPETHLQGFSPLGVAPRLLEVLERKKLTQPTPIQHQAIPSLLQGKDIIGIAQTGTVKTLAFGLPMLQRLAAGKRRALVVVPTRELAYQVEESLIPFASVLGIRIVTIVGGASMHQQKQLIRQNPRVVVATPGRLNDHLQQRTITLNEVDVLVLDEADKMFDMGFKPQIEQIVRHVPKERQTMIFSATMPPEILKLATHHMVLPLRVEVAPAGTAAANVEQELFIVPKAQKLNLLETVLKEYAGTILIFSRTKHGAKKMTTAIRTMGHTAAEIHANRSLVQRREALAGFKNGKYRVLVATDIAARGIDVTGIQVVINYDLPDDASDYVHRIGRTARAGSAGLAIAFATPDQSKHIRNIERLTRIPLRRKQLPNLPPPKHQEPSSSYEGSHYRERNPTPQRNNFRHAPRGRGGFKGRRR